VASDKAQKIISDNYYEFLAVPSINMIPATG
jgi:hypothetical protein